MANMDYCKFQNTEMDLKQCLEALENDNLKKLSRGEKVSAMRLIDMARRIAEMFEGDDVKDVFFGTDEE